MTRSSAPVVIRDAVAGLDASACAAIYQPYVVGTAVTFEESAPDADEFARRIADAQQTHVWLIAESSDRVEGFAYAHPFRERAAYRFSCEVSVYLQADARGYGLGTQLYTALLQRVSDLGCRMACAGVTLPNPASIRLHTALGFAPIGVYRRVGWKHGAWRDVQWFQKALGPCDDSAPDDLRKP